MNDMPIVISIKPKWADLIKKGIKTIEVRKYFIPLAEKWYVYESSPVKRITASFEVTSIRRFQRGFVDTVPSLQCADSFSSETRLSFDELKKYMGSALILNLYKIGYLKVFDTPYTLADVGLTHAPQSWCYAKKVLP